jgi:predicted pyridoxine 5'-phosphate oxidase superfamily flavin-nucleotide-binding protein
MLAAAEWASAETNGAEIILRAKLPPGSNLAGLILAITLDATGCISRVAQQMVPNPPAPPTPLALTPEIKDAVNNALANGTPVIVTYVDAQGQPHMSPRGTAQALSDHQLAVWNRDPEGGMTKGVAANPRVALFYRDGPKRTQYTFTGRARVASDPADRDRIYEASPEVERNFDARRLGTAVIIDLDFVEGAGPSGRVRMSRQ